MILNIETAGSTATHASTIQDVDNGFARAWCIRGRAATSKHLNRTSNATSHQVSTNSSLALELHGSRSDHRCAAFCSDSTSWELMCIRYQPSVRSLPIPIHLAHRRRPPALGETEQSVYRLRRHPRRRPHLERQHLRKSNDVQSQES